MLVKRLTKELERINNKIHRNMNKGLKLAKKRGLLIMRKHELKQLLDIEEMKERNKHESSK